MWGESERGPRLPELVDRLTNALSDRYRIIRLIGRGGMAHVYLAEELHLHREVALKVLDPELAVEIGSGRFLREVDLASKLAHPHILPIFSAGEAGGLLYYVMPFAADDSLRNCLKDGEAFPIPDALRITCEVADALAYAHAKSVVHRDIKPENILISGDHALVADFGIARPINSVVNTNITAVGSVIGTPAYMSPEQMLGLNDVDGRTDIYSLGCVLFELLTGRVAFQGSTPQTILRKKMGAPPRLELDRRKTPKELQGIVDCALANDPDERFADAGQFRDAIRGVITPSAFTVPDRRATPRSTTRINRPNRFIDSRLSLTAVMVFVLLLNWGETSLETFLDSYVPWIADIQHGIAHAMQWLELDYTFAGHDVTNKIAVYGFSGAYFFVFPILFLAIGLSLALRKDISAYRVYVSAATLDYLISLPFFILFPVPERWSFSESGAVMLSDRWSSGLIEAIRPLSGLDNSFPSFHVSLTMIMVVVSLIYNLRLKWVNALLGATVTLSTFALGIHWLADIVAGMAVGLISVAAAMKSESARNSGAPNQWLQGISLFPRFGRV